ncbi:carbamoyltransferase C-terminal domain-containing protein [Actinomadura sp. NPDC023710]|uniref:carbamoyltransferase C-terminal domain-containing protein n=1 Tax=Actinomadura sp. NPDC023710 TaxID=3158219 RepID=UPI00340FD359
MFRGRLEAGPRALGHRSILASPLQPGVMERLNDRVKFREPFRPFAPVVLADHAADYFTLGQPSPFMSIASGATDLACQAIPSIVHVNGTARVQTVTREQNRFLAEVLAAFGARTGYPVLINTSLNIKGKPICGTPEAALDCLTGSGLDGLLLGTRITHGAVKIGYSFWGFMGAGITDTPDGGRSHRATLIDGLTAAGHHVVFLQVNRDLDEARDDLGDRYTWEQRLPDIDVLMCEWRWPIPGRNTTACGTPGHTCDLHRQDELLAHYTCDRYLPTLLWDKDLQLPGDHRLRHADNVTVCEAALHPRAGAARLLFPVADAALDNADPVALAAASRDLPLVYIGNQYDRDAEFDRYFAPVAATVPIASPGNGPPPSAGPS